MRHPLMRGALPARGADPPDPPHRGSSRRWESEQRRLYSCREAPGLELRRCDGSGGPHGSRARQRPGGLRRAASSTCYLHPGRRCELEDLDAEAALALGKEGVAVGQLARGVEAVGLDDGVAVLVAWRRVRSLVTDGLARPPPRSTVGKRGADAAHPLAPRAPLLGGLVWRHVLHRRGRTAVKVQVLAHL